MKTFRTLQRLGDERKFNTFIEHGVDKWKR